MSDASPIQLTIGGHEFSLVPLAEATFAERAAVYVIVVGSEATGWRIVDVGHPGSYGSGINARARRESWPALAGGEPTWVGTVPMPATRHSERERDDLEMLIATRLMKPAPPAR